MFILYYFALHFHTNNYFCIRSSISPTSKSWYPDWQKQLCVQDCREEEGPNCGGLAEKWEKDELFSTAELCCEKKFNWISECPYESINARRLKAKETPEDIDKSEIKVVMKIKAVEERIGDMGEALEDKLEEVHLNSRVMEGRIATMEGDMKDMRDDMKDTRDDMKEIKELLAQLLKE